MDLMQIFDTLKSNKLKHIKTYDSTIQKYSNIDDEGNAIDCLKSKGMNIYDKNGNLIDCKNLSGTDTDETDTSTCSANTSSVLSSTVVSTTGDITANESFVGRIVSSYCNDVIKHKLTSTPTLTLATVSSEKQKGSDIANALNAPKPTKHLPLLPGLSPFVKACEKKNPIKNPSQVEQTAVNKASENMLNLVRKKNLVTAAIIKTPTQPQPSTSTQSRNINGQNLHLDFNFELSDISNDEDYVDPLEKCCKRLATARNVSPPIAPAQNPPLDQTLTNDLDPIPKRPKLILRVDENDQIDRPDPLFNMCAAKKKMSVLSKSNRPIRVMKRTDPTTIEDCYQDTLFNLLQVKNPLKQKV